MSKALLAAGTLVLVVIGSIAGLMLFSTMQGGGETGKVADTLKLDITAMDAYAGERDADTTAVDIYRMSDGDYVKQESVTLDAAQKATALTYTTGEELYFKVYDSSDTSLCTRYISTTVPYASWAEQNDQAFQVTIHTFDRGDNGYDALVKYHNNTAIAASATLDVTNESWDSDYAEIDFELRNTNDDTGYRNSYNFLKDYENNHYIVFTASGTGWDSVNMLTRDTDEGSIQVYDKADTRYFVIKLGDKAIDRDKKSDGSFSPDGTIQIPLVFDLTGFESGDSVTFSYMYKYYASWDYFQESSNWGTDAANNPASESVTIQY